MHESKPFFSVQFHPEHTAGPEDLGNFNECRLTSCTQFYRSMQVLNFLGGKFSILQIIDPSEYCDLFVFGNKKITILFLYSNMTLIEIKYRMSL